MMTATTTAAAASIRDKDYRNEKDGDDDDDNKTVCDFFLHKTKFNTRITAIQNSRVQLCALLKQTLKSNANAFVHPVQSIFHQSI